MHPDTKDGSDRQCGARVVRVADAARMLAVSPRSIWRLISQGRLEKVQIGRAVRVAVDSIEVFLAQGGER